MTINPCQGCGEDVQGRPLCRPCQYAWEMAETSDYEAWLAERREKTRKTRYMG